LTGGVGDRRDVLSQSAPPCIPYLGVHLSDLTFIEDGNPDAIRGLINFTKRRFLFRVISEISRYQQNAYNLHPVPQVQVCAEPSCPHIAVSALSVQWLTPDWPW
jgi:hypothetical protein